MVHVVIPVLNPNEKFIKLLEDLKKEKISNIIVVDDGSNKSSQKYFDIAKNEYGVTLLVHDVNKGKGRALKTAFEYYIKKYKKGLGVVTADADYQHSVKDIKRIINTMEKNPNDLILGVRNFSLPQVPKRNKTGNKITCFAFRSLCGVKISDTQTGLRGIPTSYIKYLIDLPGERFEYETNMLLKTKDEEIKVREIIINTIYEDDSNEGSHFNAWKDSLLIYKCIFDYSKYSYLLYALLGLIAALVVYGLFNLLMIFI